MSNRNPLPYRYEFRVDELSEIRACNDEHGFAIVKDVLDSDRVERLKQSVRDAFAPLLETAPPEFKTHVVGDFIEMSEALASLMTYEPYMNIVHCLYDTPEITLNRSAAIYKKPGAVAGPWHTDWEPLEGVYGPNALLNNTGACSNWFYLTGIHPDRGGLAIIPDSHTEDWPGLEGFSFTEQGRSFYRQGEPEAPYDKFDFPQVLRLYTNPGDLIIFAERTFHGVFPHNGDETRLSCGMSFRPGRSAFPGCWPRSESTQRFIAAAPPNVQPMLTYYTGFDSKWRSDQ